MAKPTGISHEGGETGSFGGHGSPVLGNFHVVGAQMMHIRRINAANVNV